MESIDSNRSIEVMPRMLGRYELLGALARGGMATVHLARHRAEAGFQRLFAIKVMHAHLADEEEFVSMLLDEARLAARLHHPNVVPIVDLGSQDGIHYVVMEYVEGCSLAALLAKFRDQRPPRMLVAILLDVLSGLHAAHSLTDDDGNPMNLVHRDVSPQNVMVGVDGTARLTDFGIARAESRIMSTRPGQMKGKIAFMSPEQIRAAQTIDCRSDLFSAGAMAWSALTGRRLFLGDSDAMTLGNILNMKLTPPSLVGFKPPAEFDDVIMRALARDPADRFANAQEMEEALREAADKGACLGTRREVAAWVTAGFGEALSERRRAIKAAVSVDRISVETASASSRSAPSFGAFTPSHPSMPALLTMPTLDALTPSNPGLPTPSNPDNLPFAGLSNPLFADPAGLTPASLEISVATPTTRSQPEVETPVSSQPKSKRRLLAVAAVGLISLATVIALVVPRATKTQSAQAPKPLPVESAASVASTPAAPVIEPAATLTQQPVAAATANATEREAARSASAQKWTGAGPVKTAKAESTVKATTEVPPTPPAAPKEPPKKPALWDKDSPLPPE